MLEPADRAWFDEVHFVPFWLAPAVIAANLYWLTRDPIRYVRAIATIVALPHQPRVLTLRALILGVVAAWIARDIQRAGGCRHVHAHFALAQTEVAMAVSALLGCPFTFTAHARDIYATPSALAEKMRAAARVVTCTQYNVDYLRARCPDLPSGHIALVHHGVAVERAPTRAADPQADALVVAAGRLVDKKGFGILIDACARLRESGVRFHCRLYGDGPLSGSLARAIRVAGLTDHVHLAGWVDGPALAQALATAAVFAMPSQVSKGGDRDGIPNVVLEAMAAGVPVVATRVSGIPEAVQDGVNGILVEPGDANALADALQQVLDAPDRRLSMGRAGRARAEEEFDLTVSARRLTAAFRSVSGQ